MTCPYCQVTLWPMWVKKPFEDAYTRILCLLCGERWSVPHDGVVVVRCEVVRKEAAVRGSLRR